MKSQRNILGVDFLCLYIQIVYFTELKTNKK